MLIKAYQCGAGDCIAIKAGTNLDKNIIIDAGFLSTYRQTIKKEIKDIESLGQRVNLLALTHNDRDHVSGIKGIIRDDLIDSIDECWFNNPHLRISDSNGLLGYKQGNQIGKLLCEKKLKVNSYITCKDKEKTIDGIRFRILSPEKSFLDEYMQGWEEESEHFLAGRSNDWSYGIEALSNHEEQITTSPHNEASLAFTLEEKHKRVLLLADSCANTIVRSLKELGFSRIKKMDCDLVKLSHHGSKYNLSRELLDLIKCNKFLITSKGNSVHKEALARILTHPDRQEETIFYFNYQEHNYNGLFTLEEHRAYRFTIEFAKFNDNLICFSI